MTEAQKRAQKKYDANKTKTFTIKLNLNTDADIVAELEAADNVQGFIKKLIAAHVSRRKKNESY